VRVHRNWRGEATACYFYQPYTYFSILMHDIGPEGFGLKRRDWNGLDFHHRLSRSGRPKAMKDGPI